jgi:hypothetical protein
MTTREYIEHRGRLAYKTTFWSLLGVIIGWALWATISKETAPGVATAISLAVLLAAFPVIAYLGQTKCPRCAGELSRLASRAMSKQSLNANTCPHCGVSLNEQTDGPPLEPLLDRIVTIRKTVHARAAKVSFALYVFIPIFFYALFWAPRWSASQLVAIALGAIALSIPAIFINRTPCPKCGRALGMVASRISSAGRGVKCKACCFSSLISAA